MTLSDLRLDSTRSYMESSTGKKYQIKKQRGRYYIQTATGQLTVTPLLKQVIPIDGSMTDYILNGWFELYDYEMYKSFMEAEVKWN